MAAMDVFLDRLDPDMCVVTAAADGERAGCLVGFSSQCSIRPVRYVVWISDVNRTFRVARSADVLAVHLLARDQRATAELFGGLTGDDVDKFGRVRWREAYGGAAVLEDAEAWFVGRVLERMPGATTSVSSSSRSSGAGASGPPHRCCGSPTRAPSGPGIRWTEAPSPSAPVGARPASDPCPFSVRSVSVQRPAVPRSASASVTARTLRAMCCNWRTSAAYSLMVCSMAASCRPSRGRSARAVCSAVRATRISCWTWICACRASSTGCRIRAG